MSNSVSINPPVKAGWLRVLIYFLVFLILSGSGLVVYMLGVRKGSLDLRGFQELEKTGNLLPCYRDSFHNRSGDHLCVSSLG